MKIRQTLIIGTLLCVLSVAFIYSLSNRATASVADGTRFVMTLDSTGRDSVEFQGAALADNLRLAGRVGGIESVILNRSGTIYVLTPAIKTFREIENPSPPLDTGNWPEWLIEPGRINPFSFAGLVGLNDAVSGRRTLGDSGDVEATFDDGFLTSISFPVLSGDGNITYSYSGVETDDDVTAGLFEVPEDYLLAE